jgi:hypothetical protein
MLAVFLVTAVARPHLSAQADDVPASLRIAASGSLLDFGRALAKARVPAGLVVAAAERQQDVRMSQGAAEGRMRLQDLLIAFEAVHPGYRAVRTNGGIAVRPLVPTLCDAALQADVGPARLGGALDHVMVLLARLVDPSIPVPMPGGKIGSVLSRPEDPVVAPAVPLVALEFPRVTFESALHRLVSVSPGTVWLLEEHREPGGPLPCQFRIVREDGSALVLGYDLSR